MMTLEEASSKGNNKLGTLDSQKNLVDAGAYPTVTALVTDSQNSENPLVTLDVD